MPTLNLIKRVTSPGAHLDHMGLRLDIIVDVEDSPATASSSSGQDIQRSSSSIVLADIQSSSSSQPVTNYNALFLYQRKEGRDYFLDVCSPADLETWPVGSPDPTYGLYRLHYVSLTFRSEQVLDQAYDELWQRVSELADSLTILSRLRGDEVVEYDFSADDAIDRSSSSDAGVRKFTLTRDALIAYPSSAPVGYRLHITCVAEGSDEKIFLWRSDLPDREMQVLTRPIAVCSPGDLVDYPADEPLAEQFPAHYRLNEWDIVSKRLSVLDDTWSKLKIDVSQLAQALKVHLGAATSVETPSAEYEA